MFNKNLPNFFRFIFNQGAPSTRSNQQSLPSGIAGKRFTFGGICTRACRLQSSIQSMSARANRFVVFDSTNFGRYVESHRSEAKVFIRCYNQFEYARFDHQRACAEGAQRIALKLSKLCFRKSAQFAQQWRSYADHGCSRLWHQFHVT